MLAWRKRPEPALYHPQAYTQPNCPLLGVTRDSEPPKKSLSTCHHGILAEPDTTAGFKESCPPHQPIGPETTIFWRYQWVTCKIESPAILRMTALRMSGPTCGKSPERRQHDLRRWRKSVSPSLGEPQSLGLAVPGPWLWVYVVMARRLTQKKVTTKGQAPTPFFGILTRF